MFMTFLLKKKKLREAIRPSTDFRGKKSQPSLKSHDDRT